MVILGLTLVVFLVLLAIYDLTQTKHAILRNFPVLGRLRYMLESIGPEIRQYFIEQDEDGKPFNREQRTYVYTSSKNENNKIGFGTQKNYGEPGQIHIRHQTLKPKKRKKLAPLVIGPRRRQPYIVEWPFGIADFSWGAISEEAIRALSSGAKLADIWMGTGEGGLTQFHLEGVKFTDATFTERLAWRIARVLASFDKRWLKTPEPIIKQIGGAKSISLEVGPAKFGFLVDNVFVLDKLIETAMLPQVKQICIKLEQGAKPGAGGMLPGPKVTPEIAAVRGVRPHEDCISPPGWEEFGNVQQLMEFIQMLQERTGKPVGFKCAIGGPDGAFIKEVAAYMQETNEGPDFIIVDGGEAGTGAAPSMLANHVALPILHAIPIVDNALRAAGVRNRVIVISSGKVITPADILIHIAMGSDAVNIGRGFFFALGCIQALQCHVNTCPTGIATQDKWLRRGLDPKAKYNRVANYAKTLQHELLMLLDSVGEEHTWELNRSHLSMVVSPGCEKSMAELFPYPPGTEHRKPDYVMLFPEAAV